MQPDPNRPLDPLWRPQASSQWWFLVAPHFEALFHGSRGPGKTDALLMDFAQEVGRGHGPAWRGILFRQSYPQLEEIRTKARRWFPELFSGARWNGGQSKWTFAGGEELLLRHMARADDYWHYHGHEYPWIGWEELTNWPTADCYEAMMACCRSSQPALPRKVRATCNPYGAGHAWVKARFVEPAPTGQGRTIDGRSRVQVFGRIGENRILLDSDPDYLATLGADSNANRRKAWLEGSWDIVAGGLFDDLWSPAIHVVDPFSVPGSWRIDRALDWGSARPFSVGWWAESDGSDVVLPDGSRRPTLRGDLYRIAEWYGWDGRPNEGRRLPVSVFAREVLERELSLGLHARPGPADSQIFARTGGPTIAEQMADAGLAWSASGKGAGSRRAGAERLRTLLAGSRPDGTGLRERPGLFVFSTCRHFIRTVPVLPRDPKDPDDVDTETEDHVYDETRYRIMARRGLGGEQRLGGFH